MHPCPEKGNENMRLLLMLQVNPRLALKDHYVICSYVTLTISHFALLCVVHLPVFLSFSVSLLVSCTVSGVEKRAGCFLKSAKLIVTAGNITNLGSANKPYKFI